MKRLLFTISFVLIAFIAFAQPETNRAGPANTVVDQNLFIGTSFRPPVFTDTTQANLARSLDSVGKVIYCTNINALWFRAGSPKRWVQILPSGGSGGQRSWLDGGNSNLLADINGNATFGAIANNGIKFITNNTTRFILDKTGVKPIDPTSQAIGINPDGYLTYVSGGGGGGLLPKFPLYSSGAYIYADTSKLDSSLVTWAQLRNKYDSSLHIGDTLLYAIAPARIYYNISANKSYIAVDTASEATTGVVTYGDYNVFNQKAATLSVVDSFVTYVGAAKTLIIKDTIRGGTFNIYEGTDVADSGMIFLAGNGYKYLRQTEDSKINSAWYGVVNYRPGFPDSVVDMYKPLMKAINYCYAHRNFTTLYVPHLVNADGSDEFYYVGSTITLTQSLNIVGDAYFLQPKTKFLFAANTTCFILKGDANQKFELENLHIKQNDVVGAYDSTKDGVLVNTFHHFKNLYFQNIAGAAVHIAACASVGDPNFGNADQSLHENVQTTNANFGTYIEGCDANIISFMNCSYSTNRRWGTYDNGFLGNIYYNCHWADNGKNFGCAVTYDGFTYVSEDSTDNINKRPDLSPEYWYQLGSGMGGTLPWNSSTHYYSGGTAAIVNVNAYAKFINPYTESFQPPMYLNLRSITEGGDNDAGTRGGIAVRNNGGLYYITNDQNETGVVTDRVSVGPTPAGNYSIYTASNAAPNTFLENIAPGSNQVYLQLKHQSNGSTAGIGYKDSLLLLAAANGELGLGTNNFYPTQQDGVISLGKSGLRFNDIWAKLTPKATPISTDSIVVSELSGRMVKVPTSAIGGGTIGGSIASTQVAVGSGSNTISGSSSLIFASSILTVASTLAISSTQVSSSSTELRMQQTGDAFGTSSFFLRNRNGEAGGTLENSGLDLIDLIFKTSTASTTNIRFEHRSSDLLNAGNTAGEIQIGPAGNTSTNFVVGAAATILRQGKLGVLNASPSEALDVTGNVRFSGALMPNNSAGTSGYYLTSAGAGAPPTWQLGFSSTSYIFNEEATGSTSSTYSLANTPIAGKIHIWKNGVSLRPTIDYTISGATVTLIAARLALDVFQNDYIK